MIGEVIGRRVVLNIRTSKENKERIKKLLDQNEKNKIEFKEEG